MGKAESGEGEVREENGGRKGGLPKKKRKTSQKSTAPTLNPHRAVNPSRTAPRRLWGSGWQHTEEEGGSESGRCPFHGGVGRSLKKKGERVFRQLTPSREKHAAPSLDASRHEMRPHSAASVARPPPRWHPAPRLLSRPPCAATAPPPPEWDGTAVVLVDHGSKRAAANAALDEFAVLYRCVRMCGGRGRSRARFFVSSTANAPLSPPSSP